MAILDYLLHPEYLDLFYFSALGVIFSCLISFLPALHIYNVIGIFLLVILKFEATMAPMQLIALCIGMIVGYSILNTVPATYFGPGDESMSYYVLPSAAWVAKGRGFDSESLFYRVHRGSKRASFPVP